MTISAYVKRTLTGLCGRCGKRPPVEGITKCAYCKKKDNINKLKCYRRRLKKRVCVLCGRKAPRSLKVCFVCSEKNKRKKKVKYKDAKHRKICHKCGSKTTGKYVSCEACRANRRRSDEALKLKVFKAYGMKCKCCGEMNVGFLTLDHVNNDGRKHRKRLGNRYMAAYKWAIDHNFPPTLQLLCMNCNWGRAQNGGICPHKQKRQNVRPRRKQSTKTS